MKSKDGKIGFKIVLIAFFANLSVAIFKFIVAFITGSSSLFSEAIHSVADTSNQIFLFLGMKSRKKKEDIKHPFGYGQEEFFWAFMAAIQIFLLGGIFSIYRSYEKLKNPEKMEMVYLAFIIIIFSIVAESISLAKTFKEIKKITGSGNTKSISKFLKDSWHVELIVVFLEDLSAISGLIVAFISIGLSYLLENPIFDILGSFIIGAILITTSFILGKEMKSLIIDESAPPEIVEEIEKILLESKDVKKIISIKSIILGVNQIFVAIKLHLDEKIPTKEIPKKIKSLEDKIKNRCEEIKSIFIEPN